MLAVNGYEDGQFDKAVSDLLKHNSTNAIFQSVTTVFQPIVSLKTGEVVGYEALSRGPANSPLESPATLFSLAEKLERTWELEYLCRQKAIEASAKLENQKLLFININPKIIEDIRFSKGFTKEQLASFHISPSRVVFEITEKSSVSNYNNFCRILQHYTEQGFRVAIDDLGSGYSGLTLLAKIRPQFVKLDLELIRSIDKDSLKQNLVKFFLEFSRVSGIILIAEGIETLDEMNTLVELGVEYGQGFYLQKPASGLTVLSDDKRRIIESLQNKMYRHSFKGVNTMPIGEIVRKDCPISPEMPCHEVDKIFSDNAQQMGLAVVKDGAGVGLIMRHRFYGKLGTRYGFSIYSKKPISMVMDNFPLIVDYTMPLDDVSRLAMSRSSEVLYDYVLVQGDKNKHLGIVTIKDLLEKTTQLEIKVAKYANPLTGLPGNVMIENNINRVINEDSKYAVVYVDVDNFKAYNDVYGFQQGDEILKLTASILEKEFSILRFKDSFLGHIGGDDFVVVISGLDKKIIENACHGVISNFDKQVLSYYNRADRERKYISTFNRKGQEETFPLMSLSLAVLTNEKTQFSSSHELAKAAADIKKKCKAVSGSCYLVS